MLKAVSSPIGGVVGRGHVVSATRRHPRAPRARARARRYQLTVEVKDASHPGQTARQTLTLTVTRSRTTGRRERQTSRPRTTRPVTASRN